MPKREDLLEKLQRKPIPSDFEVRDLDTLMNKCNCVKRQGGRGSSIAYFHKPSGRILIFDGPHPKTELYREHVKKVIKFLKEVGEISEKD